MKAIFSIFILLVSVSAYSKQELDVQRYMAISDFWSSLMTKVSPTNEQKMLGNLKDASISLEVGELEIQGATSRNFHIRATIISPELPSKMRCEFSYSIEKDLSASKELKCDLITNK